MKMPWEDAVNGLIDIGKEFIVDKDKQIEFEYKTKELSLQMASELLKTQTVPWVDALVKLMYAAQTFIRPFGAFIMTCFGAYCHYKGIPLDAGLHAVFDGAFVAWGASRHAHKSKVEEEKTKRKEIDPTYFPE